MTDEEKAALEATAKEEAEAQAEADKEAKDAEFEAEIADLSDEEKEAKRAERDANQHPDNQYYEAELKREREARKRESEARLKAEQSLADKRFKDAERRRKEKEEKEESDIEKPLTASQLEEILTKDREAIRKETQAVQIDEIANKMATSEAEKNLIIEIHKNRSFPSHLTLQEQLEESYVIANRKRLVGERNEALRALKGKDGVNRNPAMTHRDAPKAGEPKLSPADSDAIKNSGFSWNGTSRRYEKKISGGQTLVRNKDGSVTLVKAK